MSALPELFNLVDRVAVVTGGAGLLGAEFCQTLGEAGAAVVVADINSTKANEVADSLSHKGYRALSLKTDVASPQSVQEMVEAVLKAFGYLDILVNSAGLDPKFDPDHSGHTNSFEDYPIEAWNQAINVNLTGMFLCCQASVRPMLKQGGGVIVNLSSIYGLTGPDQRLYQREEKPAQFKPAYYPVTKSGAIGLTRYLATYYASKNIRVNTLSPGGVYNDHDETFVKAYSSRTVLGRMALKNDMNGALLFLVSDASAYMTGANLVVDGGWTTW